MLEDKCKIWWLNFLKKQEDHISSFGSVKFEIEFGHSGEMVMKSMYKQK